MENYSTPRTVPSIPMLNDMIQQYGDVLDTPEIRVWVHPCNGGDDSYEIFKSFKAALTYIDKNKNSDNFRTEVHPLIAFHGWEIDIFALPNPTTKE